MSEVRESENHEKGSGTPPTFRSMRPARWAAIEPRATANPGFDQLRPNQRTPSRAARHLCRHQRPPTVGAQWLEPTIPLGAQREMTEPTARR